MKATTKNVETVYGEAAVSTVVCSSCGDELLKSDAKQYIITDEYSGKSRRLGPAGTNKTVYRLGQRPDDVGWICPYCIESGPMGYTMSAIGTGAIVALAISVVALVWLTFGFLEVIL